MKEIAKDRYSYKNVKDKPLKFRIEYIWEYYKIQIIAVIVVIGIILSTLNSIFWNPPKATYVNIAAYDIMLDDGSNTDYIDLLNKAIIPPDTLNEEVVITSYYSSTGDPQQDYAMTTKLIATIASKEVDLFLIPKDYIQSFIDQGYFTTLDTVLTNTQLENLEDKIIEGKSEDGSIEKYGIDLTGNEFSKEIGLNFDNYCLCVVINSQRTDNVKNTLSHFLGK